MKHLISSEVSRARVAAWIINASKNAVDLNPTWTERRLAIQFGGHTYLVENGQIYQCAHCGNYDPQWKSSEVLAYFEEFYGIKPQEIEITCTVSISS